MHDLTLYLGGTRSGKSVHAEREALRARGPVLYVATAQRRLEDPAMMERIRAHQKRRPEHWHTLECPLGLAEHIATFLRSPQMPSSPHQPTVLIDCVTMWVTNILCSLPDPEDAVLLEKTCRKELQDLLELMDTISCHWIAVSGETGLGGIQATAMARSFCDGLGLVNQMLAARAREAWFCIAGKKLLLSD